MLRLTTVRKRLMSGMFVAALTGVMGLHAAGASAQGPGTWSIVIHFEYQDGFELDYVLQRSLSAKDVGAALAECGRSHWTGSVVRYHCYPVAE